MIKGIITIALFFATAFFCSYSHAQNYTVIDSLNNVVNGNIQDTQKVKILLGIGDQYENFNPDSPGAYLYVLEQPQEVVYPIFKEHADTT